MGQRNKFLTRHASCPYIKYEKPPEENFPNSVPGPEDPAAVTPPARRSSDEFCDSDILCSCLIMTNRKLKYSMRWSSPWFSSSRNSRTHLDINILINEYCVERKIALRTHRAKENEWKKKTQCRQHTVINNLVLLSIKSTWHGNYFTCSKMELSVIKTNIMWCSVICVATHRILNVLVYTAIWTSPSWPLTSPRLNICTAVPSLSYSTV